jgi:hypothetical protein
MANASDYSWIVLVIIIGAGMLVCCGYAVTRFYGDIDDSGIKSFSQEQLAYMSEVRHRNLDALQQYAGYVKWVRGVRVRQS